MSIQSIRRVITLPPVDPTSPAWFQSFVRGYLIQMGQQLNILQNHFQTFDASWGAVASILLNLPAAFPNTDYGVFVSPNQNNGAIWVTGLGLKSFTLNFGTVGAGTGMILAVSNA